MAKLDREQIIEQIRKELEAEAAASTQASMHRAKDVLEEFLPVLRNLAVHYQPTPAGFEEKNKHGNPAEFKEWFGLLQETCKILAPYQSPTFKAIMVAPADSGASKNVPRRFTLSVFEGGRPAGMLPPPKAANAA